MRRLGPALALLAVVLAAVPASAKPARTRPQGPAAVRFAKDFPVLKDSEWGFRLGGFGGVRRGGPIRHVPVIFVHGNNVDAADWYTVRDEFLKAGWTMQELYALHAMSRAERCCCPGSFSVCSTITESSATSRCSRAIRASKSSRRPWRSANGGLMKTLTGSGGACHWLAQRYTSVRTT